MTKILSLGGSIVAPAEPDSEFLSRFVKMAKTWLCENEENRLVIVVGGGGPARTYQAAYKKTCSLLEKDFENDDADWIGVMATRLNAQLVKALFGDLCKNEVVTNPTGEIEFDGKVLLASGWKPGFSSDNDAVLLAEKFGADTVVNLSNIKKVYDSDPRENPCAKPLSEISWEEFCKMVGTKWTPGKNVPFDPVASKKATELGLAVICAAGRDIENTLCILRGKNFEGTTIR